MGRVCQGKKSQQAQPSSLSAFRKPDQKLPCSEHRAFPVQSQSSAVRHGVCDQGPTGRVEGQFCRYWAGERETDYPNRERYSTESERVNECAAIGPLAYSLNEPVGFVGIRSMLRLRVRSESVEAVDDFDVAPEHVTCGAAKVHDGRGGRGISLT